MKFTVLGARGFVGRHLVAHLDALGHEVFAPERNDASIFDRPLDHVIYCIGLTADFRRKPFQTVHAHVSFLAEVLERADFESLLYLSSTRVYSRTADTCETALLSSDLCDPSDLFNLSKLLGESICLHSGRSGTRVARLSNVVGFDSESENFLPTLIREALSGRIMLLTDPASAKDYIGLSDVLRVLPHIAIEGQERIYNVANGRNINNSVLSNRLSDLTGCTIEVMKSAPLITFAPIRVHRLIQEFEFIPSDPLESLPQLLEAFRANRSSD